MHAREAFNPSQRRELESWYSEWDPIYSGIRLVRVTKNLAYSNLHNGSDVHNGTDVCNSADIRNSADVHNGADVRNGIVNNCKQVIC